MFRDAICLHPYFWLHFCMNNSIKNEHTDYFAYIDDQGKDKQFKNNCYYIRQAKCIANFKKVI